MSYNNIGLNTAKGSATSGYVMRNRGAPRRPPAAPSRRSTTKQPEEAVLQHRRRRAVEVKVLLFREELEEAGAEDVDHKVAVYRERLLERDAGKSAAPRHGSAVKEAENKRARKALGIKERSRSRSPVEE